MKFAIYQKRNYTRFESSELLFAILFTEHKRQMMNQSYTIAKQRVRVLKRN